MPDEIILTPEVLAQLRVEVAAKVRMSEESGIQGAVAYVGLHPLVLGKLIDIAENYLREQECKCPSPSQTS